ncbi:hypothetical protein FLONG3_1132 [Fusarium longipes]|uniref:Uncharacterized protein n=1 Tax=Fusarium longipes TaxID=694270 RepID=A0A395T809_9HYPO|nr:hypothetical protein FLONG3_1132 [Fusarium longipes]
MNLNIPRSRRHGLVAQLGKASILLVVSLFIVCLGCLMFLVFLWGASENNHFWRTIVLAGWTARSITITSLVLRWATAAQAVTCTSMLAAILLQTGAVPLPAAASVSIIRVNNPGPWFLLGKMKTHWHRGSLLVGLLATLLTLTTLSLQFTSTVLLSQVGIAPIPVESSNLQTHYGIMTDGDTYRYMPERAPSFLDMTPARYPAFAEWNINNTDPHTTDNELPFPPNTSSNMVDTGTVLRAFLPINDDKKRNQVTEYHGWATVVDARVVCMRPNITNVVLSSDNGYTLTGLANIPQQPKGVIQQETQQGGRNFSASFSCNFYVATGGNYPGPDWPLSLCRASYHNSRQGIYSFMQSRLDKVLGDTYIILNATSSEAVGNLENYGLWDTVTVSDPGIRSIFFEITMCMSTFQAQRLEIDATRPISSLSEPTLVWNAPVGRWDTRAVLRQLGVATSKESTAERGLFDLAPRPWHWSIQPDYIDLTGDAKETVDGLSRLEDTPLYAGMVSDAQFSIFRDAAMSKNNPALALQAFFTRLCSICYYDRISMFDAVGPSREVAMVQVTRPLGWTAFIIVVVVVVAHLVWVIIITVIFRRSGTLSSIENVWASISQLLGPVTDDWIKDADTVDDKEVELSLKQRGLDKVLVGITRVENRVYLLSKEE